MIHKEVIVEWLDRYGRLECLSVFHLEFPLDLLGKTVNPQQYITKHAFWMFREPLQLRINTQ